MGRSSKTVATLKIPYAPATGRPRERLELLLTPRQAHALRCAWEHDTEKGVTFLSRTGAVKRVVTIGDTVRALLDRLEDAVTN